jgi:hypothetical protein
MSRRKRRPKARSSATRLKREAEQRAKIAARSEQALSGPKFTRKEVAAALKEAATHLFVKGGYSCTEELGVLTWGNRRADLIGNRINGDVVIVEVKSCVADFRTDDKWNSYLNLCDRFYFCFTEKTWSKIKQTAELMNRLGPQVGIIIVQRSTGYARIVRPSKNTRMTDANRIAILARLGWRAGDFSRRTIRARKRIFIND